MFFTTTHIRFVVQIVLAAFMAACSTMAFAQPADPTIAASDAEPLSPFTSLDSSGSSALMQSRGDSRDRYFPLTPSQRFRAFEAHLWSPGTLGGAAEGAVIMQFQHTWPGYGRGVQGFSKRYGALVADSNAGSFFGTFLFPSLLRQDPRYFRLGHDTSIWRRTAYAVSRTAFARTNSGGLSFNGSLLFSVIASQALKNLYYPAQERGLSATLQRSRNALIGNAQDNLSREFLPDIEHFLWRHAPSAIKRLEQRMPMRRYWEPAEIRNAGSNF